MRPRSVGYRRAVDREVPDRHSVDRLCVAASSDPARSRPHTSIGDIAQGDVPGPLSIKSVERPGVGEVRAENLSAVDVLDNDVFERNVLERAVVGDHHRHCPGINPVVLTVFQHNVVVEPDIPECNAPRLGAYEHIVRLVGPENAVADLVVADLEIAKPGNHPDRPVGIGAVGIRMGSDVFGRGIESLDGHVIVVVTLEGVFDQHIAAADEIHAVGVHDPADLLDVVDKMRKILILRELSKTIRIFAMFYRIDNLI